MSDSFNPFHIVSESVRALKAMIAVVEGIPLDGLPPEKVEEFDCERRKLRLQSRLADLFLFYMAETQRCLDAKAFFSANVAGAATLQTVLLMKAILEEHRVLQTNAWQSSHKKMDLAFTDKLLKADLRLLLSVAVELAWLGHRSPLLDQQFALSFGPEVTRELLDYAPRPEEAAHWAQRVRNMIHPERCIREQFEPTDEHGVFAFFCLVQAFSALIPQSGVLGASNSAGAL